MADHTITCGLVAVGLLPQDRQFKLIDMGSGCGGLACKLAKILPHGSYHGIETVILPCWISKLRTLLSKQIAYLNGKISGK